MKKFISLFIAASLIIGCLCACSSGSAAGATAPQNGESAMNSGSSDSTTEQNKIQIITTIFPEYDWVMNVLGENPANAEVTMLLDNGVDLHSFQPTAEDILKISTCDMFIYVGGESNEWVEDALQEAANKDMVVIDLLEALGDLVKEEEMVEGMQEEEHDHEHEEGEDHDHEEEETEYDEHVWLSLRNAAALVRVISDGIQKIDPDNAQTYSSNTTAYVEKLNALDQEYTAAVGKASYHTLLFGDRFPFRYLTEDYGLDYFAAFVGCSAETEASFETITFLAQKLDELGLPAVMTIEGNDHRIAETIVQSTKAKNQQILTMDSMQATTLKDVQGGVTYLSIMENNLSVLKDALK